MRRLLVLFLCLFLVGCQSSYGLPDNKIPETPAPKIPSETPIEEPVAEIPDDELDFELIRPNEVGKVMVLMYHEVGGKEATWTRTTENFRQDMDTLYEQGYRPVNLKDFLSGNIDIPAGTTPFILTFDDGTAGQFRFIEQDGEKILDPDCAVAVLLQTAEKHEDFTPAGTFYIFHPVPFRQKDYIEEKLELLISWGFEIGNHSYNHENLGKVSKQDAIISLARHVKTTQQYLPGYQVNSLALPYGARPQDDSYIIRGTWEDISYQNDAILLVGAHPAQSPYAINFDPHRLPRVRADSIELERWLEHFKNKPEERYISDGDINTITVPENLADKIAESRLNGRTLRTY